MINTVRPTFPYKRRVRAKVGTHEPDIAVTSGHPMINRNV
jgi:hypothetical protein